MAYVTHSNFSALPADAYSDISGANSVIDAEGVNASGIADNYIRKRKTLPLIAPYDGGLVAAVQDITAWRLLKYRGFNVAPGADDEVVKAKDEAIKWLEAVRDGVIELDGLDSSSDQVDLMGTLSDEGSTVDWQYQTGEDCS